jgi:hypothetical protein
MKSSSALVVFFTLLLAVGISTHTAIAESKQIDLKGLEIREYKLSNMLDRDIQIKEHLGNLFVAYRPTNMSYTKLGNKHIAVFAYAYIFYEKDNKKVILGKIDAHGVYNASGTSIKVIDPKRSDYISFIGVSDSILKDPLSPSLITKDEQGFRELNVFVPLEIDFEKNTLIEHVVAYD